MVLRSVVVTIIMGIGLSSAADNPTPYSIQFVGEDSLPIPDATISFIAIKDGLPTGEISIIDRKLGATCELTINHLPDEYAITLSSYENFYFHIWHSSLIQLKPGNNVIKLEQSGTVSLTFAKVDKSLAPPFTIKCYRAAPHGEYAFVTHKIVSRIEIGKPITIQGLPPGDFKFELWNDSTMSLYGAIKPVPIRKRSVTKLRDLAASIPR